MDPQEMDGSTLTPETKVDFMNTSTVIEEDEMGDRSADSEPLPNGDGKFRVFAYIDVETSPSASHVRGLPHSSSSYNLRSRAVTPGRIDSPNDKGVSRTLLLSHQVGN